MYYDGVCCGLWHVSKAETHKGKGSGRDEREGEQPASRNKSNAVDELATRRQHELHVCSSLANILSKCVTVKGRGRETVEGRERKRGGGKGEHIIASYDLFIGTTR